MVGVGGLVGGVQAEIDKELFQLCQERSFNVIAGGHVVAILAL